MTETTPPSDDVREALTKRLADEVEYRVRTAVTLAMNGHEYEQHVTQGRESVAAILAEVRPREMVTPPADDVHPAHSGHRFGGGYARASAMLAGDPNWMNATGGQPADDVRKALSIEVLRASDEDKPVWDRGLEEIVDAILAAFEVHPHGTVTDAEAKRIREAIGPKFHGLSYRERLIVRAVLEAAREVQP